MTRYYSRWGKCPILKAEEQRIGKVTQQRINCTVSADLGWDVI